MKKYLVVIEGIADQTVQTVYMSDKEDDAEFVYMNSQYGERREMYIYTCEGYKLLYR